MEEVLERPLLGVFAGWAWHRYAPFHRSEIFCLAIFLRCSDPLLTLREINFFSLNVLSFMSQCLPLPENSVYEACVLIDLLTFAVCCLIHTLEMFIHYWVLLAHIHSNHFKHVVLCSYSSCYDSELPIRKAAAGFFLAPLSFPFPCFKCSITHALLP